ncbi:hypothetical protein VNI00_008128 [Paramarasmius palmivorus]|uniref:Uncharacterized protein n=1 Tax=Paramarasmius palmivorus TaxID=297713 RepID=A0AAW0CZ62_9AGAR
MLLSHSNIFSHFENQKEPILLPVVYDGSLNWLQFFDREEEEGYEEEDEDEGYCDDDDIDGEVEEEEEEEEEEAQPYISDEELALRKVVFTRTLQEMNIVANGALLLKSDYEESVRSLVSRFNQSPICDSESQILSRRVNKALAREFRTGTSTASPQILEFILHRAITMVETLGQVSLRKRKYTFCPVQAVDNNKIPALRFVVHALYSITPGLDPRPDSDASSGLPRLAAGDSVIIFKAKKTYDRPGELTQWEIEQVVCEIYALLEHEGKRIGRAILSDGFNWVFVLVQKGKEDDGDGGGGGGTYVFGSGSQPYIRALDRKRPFDVVLDEASADRTAAVVANWVMCSTVLNDGIEIDMAGIDSLFWF